MKRSFFICLLAGGILSCKGEAQTDPDPPESRAGKNLRPPAAVGYGQGLSKAVTKAKDLKVTVEAKQKKDLDHYEEGLK